MAKKIQGMNKIIKTLHGKEPRQRIHAPKYKKQPISSIQKISMSFSNKRYTSLGCHTLWFE